MATAVIMPRQGQSVESCILVEWLVKKGDTVSEGQPLANIETDKAVFEVESPTAGEVLALFAEAGDDIPVLQTIAALGTTGEDVSGLAPEGAAASAPTAPASAPAPAATDAAPAPAPTPAATPSGSASGVSPRARQLASDKGLDASGLAGSGPHGRVIARDVAAAAAASPRLSGAAQAALAAGGATAPATGTGPGGMVLASDLVAGGEGTAVPPPAPSSAPVETPVTGIRKIIAERMHASLANTAQLTMSRSFDATALLSYRAKIKKQAEAMGLPSITLNDMVVFGVARTLKQFPELNAHFLGDRIVQFAEVNLGIAVDTSRGLMVPVLKGVDRMSLSQISAAIKPLAESAMAGSISPDLLSGGTFTITNLGMLGIETFTPVLNAPEVGILGVGGLQLKPVMKEGEVVHVQSMTLSLTIDHQAVDGAPGARFLQALATALENFELALA